MIFILYSKILAYLKNLPVLLNSLIRKSYYSYFKWRVLNGQFDEIYLLKSTILQNILKKSIISWNNLDERHYDGIKFEGKYDLTKFFEK